MLAALSSACGSDTSATTTAAPATPRRETSPDQLAAAEPESSSPDTQALPATCLLAGCDEIVRRGNLAEVTWQYIMAQMEACEARALTSSMSDDALVDWANYLENYTHALFGCGVLYEPLPGGVDAFGLANTEVVGVPNPAISAAEARFLISMYMEACTSQLGASTEALVPIRQHLEQAAAGWVVSDADGDLGDCAAQDP